MGTVLSVYVMIIQPIIPYLIFSHSSGGTSSGKTFTSLLLMQHLFDVAGGLPVAGSSASGTQTDSYKHLQAIFCVLRSLTCAATKDNKHSSQMVKLVIIINTIIIIHMYM